MKASIIHALRFFCVVVAVVFTGFGSGEALGQTSVEDDIARIKTLLYKAPDSAQIVCRRLIDDKSSIEPKHWVSAQRLYGIALDLMGEYESSLAAYDQAIIGAESLNDSVQWADAKLGQAIIYHRLRQFDKALDFYTLSHGVYKRFEEPQKMQAVLGNIAALYNNVGLYEDAIDIYRIQLKNDDLIKDSNAIAGIYLNMANAFEQKGEIDSAVNYNNHSLLIHKDLQDYYGLGANYHTKGTMFKNLGILDSAIHYYELSIRPAAGVFRKSMLSSILLLIGETFEMKGMTKLSKVYIDSALRVLQAGNYDPIVMNKAKRLEAEVLQKLGDGEGAAAAWKTAYTILDSIEHDKMDARLIRFARETKAVYYERTIAKKLRENEALIAENEVKSKYLFWVLFSGIVLIALLIAFYMAWWNHKRYSKVLAERNKELDQHLQANKRLLSLLAHDFRSPMKGMSSMLDLYVSDDISKADRLAFVEKARKHIKTTVRGMDQMLVWITKDKKKTTASSVDLNEMMNEVARFYIWDIEQKAIELNYQQLEGNSMWFDQRNLEAIARNVLGNSIKYCPPGARIDINYSKSDKKEILSFHDNGPGIEERTLKLIREGRFNEVQPKQGQHLSTGLGMELIHDLAALNHAEIIIDSTPGKGTSISIARLLHP